MKWIFLILTLIAISSCAKNDPEILATDELAISTYATRSNSEYVYCSVAFYRKDELSTLYPLEQNSIVACNGVEAQASGTGYATSVYQLTNEPLRITVVRPKAGATIIEYVEIQ